jgi:peptidoglycan/xylan/chitin deacetylase (PgdA/CDA1 family)
MTKLSKNNPLYRAVRTGYKLITEPQRESGRLFKKSALILLYHRVAEVKNDPLRLSVSPENFEKQLAWAKTHFKIIPLAEMAKRVKECSLEDNTLAVTFDDGYADNALTALPILKKLGVPATIFVTAGNVENQTEFYWDAETPKEDRGRPMTQEELIRLFQEPLIEIGAHTVTHPHLAQENPEKQRLELSESRKKLEKILGKEITGFAYPFGGINNFTEETVQIARESGYAYACANIQGRVSKMSDPYALPRCIVRNWDMEEFEARLTNLQP